MAQAPLEHGFPFDLLSLFQDLLCAPEVDVGGRQVSKALVVAMVVVMFDKGADLALEVSGQEVMLEQNTVLHGLVPPLDLALCLGGVGGAADIISLRPGYQRSRIIYCCDVSWQQLSESCRTLVVQNQCVILSHKFPKTEGVLLLIVFQHIRVKILKANRT